MSQGEARPLEGSVALVTGASRGIGAAVALELARLGAHCVLTARTQGALEELDDAIRALGGSATLFPLDLVKDGEKLDMLGPSIVSRFGRLDILVHAAGRAAEADAGRAYHAAGLAVCRRGQPHRLLAASSAPATRRCAPPRPGGR